MGSIMKRKKKSYFLLPFLFLISILLQKPTSAAKKSYVVYFGGHTHGSEEAFLDSYERVTDAHYEFLGSVLGSKEKAQDAIFYSYTNYINGFAASLEEEEAMEISKDSSVISVFPNRGHKLHTTRSWDFLGLERNGRVPLNSIWSKANFGEDVIIGNLDTGVWPESESFREEGMGPSPSQWRGICQDEPEKGAGCNRKLIGMRYFNKGYLSAVGPAVSAASARDTAKGGAPNARAAAYKVCWPPVNGSECFDADILAAFDAAIHDGVHVLSVSLGGGPTDYFKDGVAIGSFHAVKNGVTVVCSAGNSGPDPGSVSNTAPWIITVGASTMDREFPAYLLLSNKKQIKGQSLSPSGHPGNKYYPIIRSAQAKAANATEDEADLCLQKSLDPAKAGGKIVVCIRGNNARVEKGEVVREAGGVGMILANDQATGNELIADAHVLPATHISYSDGLALLSYINSAKSAAGYITSPKTDIGTKPAPFMAAFSSQGPNTITPEILKPDITAPGVSILAAYTGASGPTGLAFDDRRVLFNSESGTSMSCPHVSGIAGLLKALHPEWSPSAIKSAIMTTSRIQDNLKEPMKNSSFLKATPFSYGSGHVQPNRAMDPGLVYDLGANDYLNFLCSLGYNSTQIATFSVEPYTCPSKPAKLEDLNYPSISIPNLAGEITITRTVRNVGTPGTYSVRVEEPRGVLVLVEPTSLKFDKVDEEKRFKVIFKAKERNLRGEYVFGRIIWSDGKHFVRSPIVVKTVMHKP
ncbi:subtilisin-like protease SBT5.3 [Ananas comosus]|uniref:Subtilisin-like protease SBT5.3 n=1 Tax=Ananas comosus TaxID=4615 RepID=A0A6P5GQV4_ANACO|nr:subtilisin-like protease SBT5.3 [Ananas comosus]